VLITHTHTYTSDVDEEPTAEQEQTIQDMINEANIEGTAGPIDAMIQAFISKVLGNEFHVIQRIKVRAHHDFKSAYFRGLRGTIFLMDAGDVARVK
jgi:hypothetical protein